MSEVVDEKAERFELMWDGMASGKYNRTKALKFRQYMRQHVLQKFHKRKPTQFASVQDNHYNHNFSSKDQFLTKENCKKYWMGELQAEIQESENF